MASTISGKRVGARLKRTVVSSLPSDSLDISETSLPGSTDSSKSKTTTRAADPGKSKRVGSGRSGQPLSGKGKSEQEFWDLAEKAAEHFARGVSIRSIAASLGVNPQHAFNYILRYLSTAARFFPAESIRYRLSMQYREVFGRTMRELALLERNAENGYVLGDDERAALKLQCLERLESVIEKEGKLYGFGSKLDLVIHQGAGAIEAAANLADLPPESDRRQLRALVRLQRRIIEGNGEQITRGHMAEILEGSFADGKEHHADAESGLEPESVEPEADAADPAEEDHGSGDDLSLRGL